jgi:ribonuclease T1
MLAAALLCFFALPGLAFQEGIRAKNLPPEARTTLELIKKGGPFPYERDGVVFSNREKRLPAHPRGYYREYTVKTPGVKHRGARRIVVGGGAVFYYTEDHYNSFRRILDP